MSDAVLIALITTGGSIVVGALTLLGVVISNSKARRETKQQVAQMGAQVATDIEQKLLVAQAVTDTKIEELTREVREHNGFARRMPVVEEKIEHIVETEEHMQEEIDHLRTFHEK